MSRVRPTTSAIIDATTKTDPATAEVRSPMRTATYPARGPEMAKASGRAIISPPTRVSG